MKISFQMKLKKSNKILNSIILNSIIRCTICQYDFIDNEYIKELGCYHKFHLECLDTWLTQKKNCPNCNEEINVNNEI